MSNDWPLKTKFVTYDSSFCDSSLMTHHYVTPHLWLITYDSPLIWLLISWLLISWLITYDSSWWCDSSPLFVDSLWWPLCTCVSVRNAAHSRVKVMCLPETTNDWPHSLPSGSREINACKRKFIRKLMFLFFIRFMYFSD